MGKTITEKILARTCGEKEVTPGEVHWFTPDYLLVVEFYAGTAINFWQKDLGVKKVWDPNRVVLYIDHTPECSISPPYAEIHKKIRQFVKEQGIRHWYDIGRAGLSHQLAVEKGFARPGLLILGDEHDQAAIGAVGTLLQWVGNELPAVLFTGKTWLRVPESFKINVTGKFQPGVLSRDLGMKVGTDLGPDGTAMGVLEYHGPTIKNMDIDARMTLCSQCYISGGDSAIINPDQRTEDYVKSRTNETFESVTSDTSAHYQEVFDYDVSNLNPQVIPPTTPPKIDNAKDIATVEGVEIDQACIGSCASGRMEDLRIAAHILKGRKISPNVRMYITPISQEIYITAAREGLLEIFALADAAILTPGCGTCWGYQGSLPAGDTCIATHTINYAGRMGSEKAKIYLANPATVASSALEGKIADPRKYLT